MTMKTIMKKVRDVLSWLPVRFTFTRTQVPALRPEDSIQSNERDKKRTEKQTIEATVRVQRLTDLYDIRTENTDLPNGVSARHDN